MVDGAPTKVLIGVQLSGWLQGSFTHPFPTHSRAQAMVSAPSGAVTWAWGPPWDGTRTGN